MGGATRSEIFIQHSRVARDRLRDELEPVPLIEETRPKGGGPPLGKVTLTLAV